jgi:hypothetical protein
MQLITCKFLSDYKLGNAINSYNQLTLSLKTELHSLTSCQVLIYLMQVV